MRIIVSDLVASRSARQRVLKKKSEGSWFWVLSWQSGLIVKASQHCGMAFCECPITIWHCSMRMVRVQTIEYCSSVHTHSPTWLVKPQAMRKSLHLQWSSNACVLAGIFLPSLSVGAAGGRLFAIAIQAIVASMGSDLKISLPAYAVSGSPATGMQP